jgi:hypothetical protein
VIEITRALARQFRAALRKAGAGRNQRPLLEFRSAQGVLRMRAQLPEVAIEYSQRGPADEEALPVPFDALEDCEGRSNSTVTFVRTAQGVEAAWEDDKIPKRKSYELPNPEGLPAIPELDWSKATVVPGLFQALEAAGQCIAKDVVRYATNRIQIRGGRGEIISSDGRQALIQGGFTFGFKEDLLIPSVALFGCRDLPLDLPASVLKGENHVGIRIGDWSIFLIIDTHGRFPDVAKAIPTVTPSATTLRLGPQDAEFLSQSLGKLPGGRDDCAPVTVDLNGQVALRAKDEGQGSPTEVVLAGSTIVGAPVCWHSDRRYLARAVSLGFSELSIVGADKPVVCKDGTRTYCWVPLDKAQAIPASANATRISTLDAATSTAQGAVAKQDSPINQPIEERTFPVAQTHSNGETNANGHLQNGHADGTPTKANTLAGLIGEAQNLRDYLHEGFARANRLVSRLKNHRKQSKLVATTLKSLRQLQQIEA